MRIFPDISQLGGISTVRGAKRILTRDPKGGWCFQKRRGCSRTLLASYLQPLRFLRAGATNPWLRRAIRMTSLSGTSSWLWYRLWHASAALATLFSVLQTATPLIRLWSKSWAMFGLLYLVVAVLSGPLGFSPMPLHMVGFTLSIGVMADWPAFPHLFGNNRIEQGKSLVAPRLDQIYYLVSQIV